MELDQLHEGIPQGHDLSKDRNLEGKPSSGTVLIRETAQRQRVAAAARMGSLARALRRPSTLLLMPGPLILTIPAGKLLIPQPSANVVEQEGWDSTGIGLI